MIQSSPLNRQLETAWPAKFCASRDLDGASGPAATPLPPLVLPPEEQLTRFINVLFEPGDLVELRVIAPAREDSSQLSHLVDRKWFRAAYVAEHFDELKTHNDAGCHAFFGVNPRSQNAGTKDAVTICRCVWLDFDHVNLNEAHGRWSSVVPEPTIVVRSGTGIHAYWRLAAPYSVDSASSRSDFERIVKGVSRATGADATHDVTRLLRLPGFFNRKTAVPIPCTLLVCEPDRQYPVSFFERWPTEPEVERTESLAVSGRFYGRRLARRIQGLLRHLDKEVADRSRRDFAVVCGFLRLGLSPDEVQRLVEGRSKFADNASYVETTIANAVRQVGIVSSNKPS